MKRMIVGLLSVCLLGSLTVLAGEKAATTEKTGKKEVALQEITVTGKLSKHAKAGFSVKEADGTIVKVMPAKATKKGEVNAELEKLEKLVGKDVKLVGMGVTKTSASGKKMTHIKTVTSVEEATTEAPAAVPAAPAAPAAAAPAEAPAAPAAAPEAK